jgi:hypothetical protein
MVVLSCLAVPDRKILRRIRITGRVCSKPEFTMGQVIRFAISLPTYPDRVNALDTAECAFLLAVRWWVADYRQNEDPLRRLCETMHTAGLEEAAFPMDRLMGVAARSARRSIEIRCPRCAYLSDDEKLLLQAASLVQAGEGEQVERMLHRTLFSAQGAMLALGPLEEVGELFSASKLLFRLRRMERESATAEAELIEA